ncbi:hypothetical protein GCM10022377_20550 [Zhihengliuella alba]|uniref:YdhG-like domain-containing protein n=1 Tax=Zhihengliuella alba TaxID=547018 RepID=A0ABP7DMV4_9MICC
MPEPVMRPTSVDARSFVSGVDHPRRRADAETLLELFGSATGEEPVMWGPSIVGFGAYHYRYATGREGDAPAVGFSPRRANLALYVLTGSEESERWLSRLGKHRRGVSCLYVNKLDDVDLDVLRQLVQEGYEHAGGGPDGPAPDRRPDGGARADARA